MGTKAFLDRRELLIVNVGADGIVHADGQTHYLQNRDMLYLGLGTQSIEFQAGTDAAPPKFYLLSAAAFAAEASPYYLFHPRAAERAAAELPTTQFVAMLRDPVERTVSHWAEQTRNGVEVMSLADALDAESDRIGDDAERLADGTLRVSNAHEQQSYASQSEYGASLATLVERRRRRACPRRLRGGVLRGTAGRARRRDRCARARSRSRRPPRAPIATPLPARAASIPPSNSG